MAVENEELDEAALFDQTVSDEPEVIPEAPEPEVEQLRDADGKFAKADEPAEVVAEIEAEKPVVDDNAPQVPSWRVREINEEKRAAVAERDALKIERDEFKRLVEETRRRPTEPTKEEAEAAKAAKPDPLLDPDGYEKYLEAKFDEKQLNRDRETSLANAHKTYKAEFEEAYASAQKNIDPALKARMQQSRDPGETLIAWHREQKTMREVGNDPNAWLEKKLEERLKDPAFLAKAVEQARGIAQPQQNNGRPRVDLPPSLNGASRSNAALRSSNDDLSDAELFAETTG